MIKTADKFNLTPFLRWTGSKRWFIKDHIESYLPEKFNNYYEPFLGAGSVFFFLKGLNTSNSHYYLSDSNEDLINCYVSLRDNLEKTIEHLKKFKNTKDDYYLYRNQKLRNNEKRAARFIYLNRTSFNGIYRVNSNGDYNVPYGKRLNVDTVTSELLTNISYAIQNVSFKCLHFEDTISNVQEGDLVFLDPPYTIAHENNGFIEYNQKLFSWEDQVLLKDYVLEIIKKGAYFILTNASHSSILDLYENIGCITKLTRSSKVGGRNKTRGLYNELVIHNII